MLAASYGLQNTSNNVANMQSYGFKRNDVFYSSLGNDQGVYIGGNNTNFSPGKYLPDQGSADLAIVGHGFFVIKLKSNELVYTRAGKFEFHNGVLIDRHTGGQVQGYDSSGNLVPIHEKGPKESPGKASRDIHISGTFNARTLLDPTTPPDPSKPAEPPHYEDIEFTLDKIYDAQGKPHSVTLKFCHGLSKPGSSQTPPGAKKELCWELDSISCVDADVTPYSQVLAFSATDSGLFEDNSRIQFILNGNQEVTIYFGNYNDGADQSVKMSTNEGSKTNIQIYDNDGYGVGKQHDYKFDEDGLITYLYDNGQTVKGTHVGLARFDDMEHNLIPEQDNFYRAKTNAGIHYGRANTNGFEAIAPKQLETSNVDSTTEFANIVVLQRMFQACSQIMDIDKQLLEELGSKS